MDIKLKQYLHSLGTCLFIRIRAIHISVAQPMGYFAIKSLVAQPIGYFAIKSLVAQPMGYFAIKSLVA